MQNERLHEELQQSNQRQLQVDAEVQALRDARIASLSSKHEGRIEHLQEQVSGSISSITVARVTARPVLRMRNIVSSPAVDLNDLFDILYRLVWNGLNLDVTSCCSVSYPVPNCFPSESGKSSVKATT